MLDRGWGKCWTDPLCRTKDSGLSGCSNIACVNRDLSLKHQNVSPAYPALLRDLALRLQLGTSLPALQDAVVLLGVDVQRLLLQHLSPRQWDPLHGGHRPAPRNHLRRDSAVVFRATGGSEEKVHRTDGFQYNSMHIVPGN